MGLGRALLLSLVIHLLLFWPEPPAPMVAGGRSLEATLRAPPPPPPALQPPAPPRRAAAPIPAPVRPQPPGTPVLATNPLPREPPVASTGETAARSGDDAPTRRAAPAAPGPGEGLDPDGLRSYRVALAREARRHKRYPPRAIEAGWQGTAQLRAAVSAEGAAGQLQIIRSSGHPVLDEAALEMVGRALDATTVPAALLGRSFAVELPVVFDLPAP